MGELSRGHTLGTGGTPFSHQLTFRSVPRAHILALTCTGAGRAGTQPRNPRPPWPFPTPTVCWGLC